MDRSRAEELLPIIKAIAEGKEIQTSGPDGWMDIKDFNNISFTNIGNFRVKPKPKLVPFTIEDAELFRDRWLKSKSNICYCLITSYSFDKISIWGLFLTYQELLDNWVFEDGSPCGKEV